jgi:hypothetical protein
MAEAMLIGAGIGAGGAMLSGNDPLQGAAVGGAMGGASAGFGGAGVASGASAGAANGASHLAMTGAEQAAASGVGGGLSSQIGGGFDSFKDATGLTNRDVTMMGVNQGLSAMQPQQQQQIQHAPMGTGISQPQVDLAQGTPTMNSNPRIKKLQMQGLL